MTCKLHRLTVLLIQDSLSEQSQGGYIAFKSCADVRWCLRTYNADVLSRKSCRPSESACNAVVLRTVKLGCDFLISGL